MAAQETELRSQRATIRILEKEATNREEKDTTEDDKMQIDSSPKQEVFTRHRSGELKCFRGDRSEWISWRTEAQTKLRTDGSAIGNDLEQFGYLYMHLQTGAQRRIQHWYNLCLKLKTNCNPIAFFERAESTFGDPNEKKNARTLLSALEQGKNETFFDFITKFEELLAQAGGKEWPQDVQVNALEDSLNGEMTSRLISYRLDAPSYYTFRAVCLSIDAKLQAMRMRSRISSQAPAGGNASRNAGNSEARGSGRDRERAPWASAEERERRRQAGLCLRCGGASHMQKGCRFRSAIDPRSNGPRINEARVLTEIGEPPQQLLIEPNSEYPGKV
ncbi:hypothetical protein K3495_g10859 [Podosphaera aphanis]|nr:hypothetical protein K3495_g10859 [Podosphaera aphanis]